jgi:hypothetical protein
MAVWGSGSFRVTLTAVCAVLWIQWTSPTWQWYSRRFDTHSDGASLLGTSNDFLAIREVRLNTIQHIANVHYTSLQPLFKTISCQVYIGETHSTIYSENSIQCSFIWGFLLCIIKFHWLQICNLCDKIFLSLMYMATAPERNLKGGFHCI